jgi:glutamate racemase
VGEGVTLVDSAVQTAIEVGRALDEHGLRGGSGDGDFAVYLSDLAPDFKQVAERILGRPIPEVRFQSV